MPIQDPALENGFCLTQTAGRIHPGRQFLLGEPFPSWPWTAHRVNKNLSFHADEKPVGPPEFWLRGRVPHSQLKVEGGSVLTTILNYLSLGVHSDLISEPGLEHPEIPVALDSAEVFLGLQEC